MKRKLLGILIMTIGFAMTVAGTALFSAAAANNGRAQEEQAEEKTDFVLAGVYLSADKTGEISVSESGVTINGEDAGSYTLSVWKDIPKTDEGSGKITLLDYYFIQLENKRISYYPEREALVLDGTEYLKSGN